MDVHEKCVAFPTTHFFDSVVCDAVEVHCHCAAGAEAVGSHEWCGEAVASQSECGDGPAHGCGHVVGREQSWKTWVVGGEIRADARLHIRGVARD